MIFHMLVYINKKKDLEKIKNEWNGLKKEINLLENKKKYKKK